MRSMWRHLHRVIKLERFGTYTLERLSATVLCFFRLMPLMLIIIIGCSSENPFWARRLGSIPSTLNAFLAIEGGTDGELAFEFAEGVEGNRYFRFFRRKTG